MESNPAYSSPIQPESRKYSLAEYFDFEFQAELKHEYHDGFIVEMDYTSEEHGMIVHNLDVLIGNCLKGKGCVIIPGGRMVYVEACNKVYYPDLTIVCGKREYHNHSKNMKATTNPSVLIEVVSETSKSRDKKSKRRCYHLIPSLKQYIIVEQDFKFIEIFQRSEDNKWVSEVYEDDDDILKIENCTILLKDIYEGIDYNDIPNAASE